MSSGTNGFRAQFPTTEFISNKYNVILLLVLKDKSLDAFLQ